MAETLHVDLVTPVRTVVSKEAREVDMPGIQGELGILPGHAPLVGTLSIGVVRLRGSDGTVSFAVRKGFLQIRDNRVTILADEAASPTEIDTASLERERTEIEGKLVDSAVGMEERPGLVEAREWISAREAVLSSAR